MRKGPSALLVLAVAVTLLAPSVARSADAAMTRHVVAALAVARAVEPAASLPRGSVRIGAAAGTMPLTLDVVLAPRDPSALASFVAGVSTPGSPTYRRYLPRGAFGRRFGPTLATVHHVIGALRAVGLHPVAVSPDRSLVLVRASVAGAEHALATTVARFRLPSGRDAFANTSPAHLPSEVAPDVAGVIGLSDVLRLAPAGGAVPTSLAAEPVRATRVEPRAVGPAPCTGATRTGAVTANVLAAAYGLDGLYSHGDLARGATIALFEPAAFASGDVAAYQHCYRTSTRVSVVRVDGGASVGSGTLEATADVEDLIGLAPQASVVVYETSNVFTPDWLDEWARIVDADTAQVVSTSWLACEQYEPTGFAAAEGVFLAQAAAQGQTVLAATGDYGSEACRQFGGSRALSVDDVASDPYVTAVGGTEWRSLAPRAGERTWDAGPGASGGGISSRWAMPSWQQGPGVRNRFSTGSPCGGGATACRETPDVAALAGPPYYAFYCSAGDCGSIRGWGSFYGTSFATPLWAASVALADRSCAAEPPAGFLDPALYALAASRADPLHDITVGDNDLTRSNGGRYPATAGFDLATGLGTPAWTTGTARLGLAGLLCLGGALPAVQQATEVSAPSGAASDPGASLRAIACATATSCAAVGSYTTASSLEEAMAAGRGATWGRATGVLAPTGAAADPLAALVGVACPAVASCTAVGGYTDATGSGEAMTAAERGGTWSQAVAVLPPANAASDPAAALTAVSCPAPGRCVGVGGYTTGAGDPEAMVAVGNGGTWSRATEVQPPANAAANPGAWLRGVACTAVGSCVGVGSYTTGSGDVESMASVETAGTWGRATAVAPPPGAAANPRAVLDGVACAAPGECVAVGSLTDVAGHGQAMAVAEIAGRWARGVEIPQPTDARVDPTASLDGVSCGSLTTCVGVGSYVDRSGRTRAMAAAASGGRWARAVGLAPPPASSADPGAVLQGVACGAGGRCVGVGAYADASGSGQAMVVQPAAPSVSRVLPARGPAAGGGAVWIIGRGLSGVTAVRFGTEPARVDGVASDAEIEVTPPKGAGTVSVTVATAWGTSPASVASRYTYVTPPIITRLAPSRGGPAGGTLVRIFGRNLSGVVAVHFGSTRGRVDRVVSASEIEVTSPRGSGAVDVTATTAGGTSVRVPADRFTY